MKKRGFQERSKVLFSALIILTMACLFQLVHNGFSQEKIVRIDGSSTVYPVTEAVAEEFQKAKKGKVKVTVGISGTGGGFKKFLRGGNRYLQCIKTD